MAENLKPKDLSKRAKEEAQEAKRQKRIRNEWREFSKTLAYEDLLDYMKNNDEMLVAYAKERVMPSPISNGEQVILTTESASSLLQNARGIDIVKTYVEEYVNSEA